tara:strand:+ start:742 stop:951 length:210 start_codon:yes stop_codon:yes gene_type:complete
MDIQAVKLELVQRILNENREAVLEKISRLFHSDELESDFNESFERALTDKEMSQTKSHDEVKKKYEKWL